MILGIISAMRAVAAWVLPTIADDNATFNDEGTATTGWTAANGTLGVTGSVLRLTKTSAPGSGSSATKSVTMPGTNVDHIMIVKPKASRTTTNHAGAFWLRNSGNTRQFVLWLNYDATAGAYSQGVVSVQVYNGGSLATAVVATGVNTETDDLEFALHYDHKWSTLNVFQRQVDNTWDLRVRVAATFNAYIEAQIVSLSTAPSGSWLEFDFWTIARPNLVVIGDSIAEGKTLYSPNRSLALSNYSSTWARYSNLYPSLRNNLVVNRGVGGETSTATLARIADATGMGARVVFLHASTNDEVNGVSQATRTSNTQSMISAISAASAHTVLLNAMYGTSTYSGNTPTPDHRDYMLDWWVNYRPTLTGAYTSLDIMQAIVNGTGFMTGSLTQSDGIHPTPAGYEDIGQAIAAAPYQ